MKLKASVLIVDDDESLRLALADRFAYWGHDVVTAPDGLQAVTLAAERAFDLILMDLTMPGIDGLETMKRLAESECSADIVVLTAHGSVQKAVEALKLGAADFLTKPADFDLLENVVERSLERRRLRRVSQAFADRTESRLVGSAPAMLKLVETANRAARADTTVILSGESGTGKQVLAEHIHAQRIDPVWTRTRGVHRRRRSQERAPGGGRRRDSFSRRDRRRESEFADQASTLSRGRRIRKGRW